MVTFLDTLYDLVFFMAKNPQIIRKHLQSTAQHDVLLKTREIIERPSIFNNGLPGSLVADNLEGIITNVFIEFIICFRL